MCIRDSVNIMLCSIECNRSKPIATDPEGASFKKDIEDWGKPVSYTHLRAHETVLDLVCRLLLEKKKKKRINDDNYTQ